jgi:hypothetical protein
MVTSHNLLCALTANDYAFIHKTNTVLDCMFYILEFILKSVYVQQTKYTTLFMVFKFLER